MVKEILEEKEPLVYACLRNDLKEDRLAHSYLLCGEKTPLKLKTAYLLAQSIIENKKDFACEECHTCKRILNNNHLDVLFIDGKDEIIKKEMIDEVLSEFSKTAVESSGKKVYIINNINNSSPKVLNMILKFMEEPSNENTFGIFISDDASGLLETVVSRCEKLNFTSCDFKEIKNEYLESGVDEFDAYLLSETIHEYIDDLELYTTAKDFIIKTIDSLDDPQYLEVMYIKELYTLKEFKEVSDYFILMIIKILDDAISNHYIGNEEYDELLDKVKNDALALLEIYLDAKQRKDNCLMIDRKLMFDEICCKIIKYKNR